MTHAGWWFASYCGREGWVPGSFLEQEDTLVTSPSDQTTLLRTDTAKANEPVCIKKDFLVAQENGETFSKGAVSQVLNKSNSGWWSAM